MPRHECGLQLVLKLNLLSPVAIKSSGQTGTWCTEYFCLKYKYNITQISRNTKHKHTNGWFCIIFVLKVVRKASHIQEKASLGQTYGQKETLDSVDMWRTCMNLCWLIDLLEVRRGTSQMGGSCHHSGTVIRDVRHRASVNEEEKALLSLLGMLPAWSSSGHRVNTHGERQSWLCPETNCMLQPGRNDQTSLERYCTSGSVWNQLK